METQDTEATPKKRASRKKTSPVEPIEESLNVSPSSEVSDETATLSADEATATDYPVEVSESPETEKEESDNLENDSHEVNNESEEILDDIDTEEENFIEDEEEYDSYEEEETDIEAEGDEELLDDEEYEDETHLTHLDSEGRAQMVDISSKPATARTAVATGYVRMSKRTLDLLEQQELPKGDALTVAEVAGIMASKRTSDLVPLCHPIPLTNVTVRCEVTPGGVLIRSEATTTAQTGVEMEALTGASVAALTLYDMCKGVDKNIVIADVRLNVKTGGATGAWQAENAPEEYPVAAASEPAADENGFDDEEQILPSSVTQPDPTRERAPYQRDQWSDPNRASTPRPPYDRDQRSGYANRTPYNSGFNRDRGATPSYGNRPTTPQSRPPYNSNPANRDRGTTGGFNRDRGTTGGYNRDRNPSAPYTPNKPAYGGGYQGSGGYSGNRDRNTSFGNRPPTNRPNYNNRDSNDRGGYSGYRNNNPNYPPNRDRGTSGYPPNKSGFAGFRDRNRERDPENE